jgi:hypothetical protein
MSGVFKSFGAKNLGSSISTILNFGSSKTLKLLIIPARPVLSTFGWTK